MDIEQIDGCSYVYFTYVVIIHFLKRIFNDLHFGFNKTCTGPVQVHNALSLELYTFTTENRDVCIFSIFRCHVRRHECKTNDLSLNMSVYLSSTRNIQIEHYNSRMLNWKRKLLPLFGI